VFLLVYEGEGQRTSDGERGLNEASEESLETAKGASVQELGERRALDLVGYQMIVRRIQGVRSRGNTYDSSF